VARELALGEVPGGLVVPRAGEGAQVWWFRVSEHAEGVQEGLGLLDAEETRRYRAFVRDRDRVSYGCAHVGLRRLMAAYVGAEPEEVAFARATCPTCGAPHGRPVLAGREMPQFSLSHSGDLVMIAVAGTTVGADVEGWPKLEFVNDISINLHPREHVELSALMEDEERRAAFVRCWTRKEAYLKGTGEGLSGTTSRDYVGTGVSPASLPGWELADCRLAEGYGAAVAVARPAVD
jgi:4'-phosphopantetheinyl transferase